METCTLNDFIETLDPWLSDSYIQRGYLNEYGDIVLLFTDGVENVYRIDDCNEGQMSDIIEKIRKSGITFERKAGKR
jgi:hypothetical protein